MFQTNWSDKPDAARASRLRERPFDRVNASYWCEHCVECSQPACYKSCENYLARRDGHCRLTEYGMRPEPDGGVTVKFRKWGKLETKRFQYVLTPEEAERLERRYAFFARATARISRAFRAIDKIGLFDNGFYVLWNRLLLLRRKGAFDAADCLYIACASRETKPFRLIAETVAPGGRVLERRAADILPGENEITVPLDLARLPRDWAGVVRVYPENGIEAEITFHALQLARMRAESAKTVKCVLWDLDGTLWNGVMTETEGDMTLRDGVRELLRAFDEKGILQSVVSKNDPDAALRQLEKLGVADYFLYPAVNWAPKSRNVRAIARSLNLNANAFLLADDSAFERGEVKENVPGIRVCDEKEIFDLARGPLFDVPVTEESRRRREMYRTEMTRGEAMAEYAGDYDAFLRSCRIELRLMPVEGEARAERCFELAQRTNQLNMTGVKYTKEAFEDILRNPKRVNAALSCRDRFGDYGVVGFVSAERERDCLVLREMTVSCRVAKKYVEDAAVAWLLRRYGAGAATLRADYVKTPRNTPMRDALEEIGLRPDEDGRLTMPVSAFRAHDAGIRATDWEDEK